MGRYCSDTGKGFYRPLKKEKESTLFALNQRETASFLIVDGESYMPHIAESGCASQALFDLFRTSITKSIDIDRIPIPIIRLITPS